MPLELTGMKELLANLETLDSDIRKHKIGALKVGAEVIRKEIVAHAVFVKGYSKGAIAKNIIIVPANTPDGELATDIGPDMSKVPYASMVEFGTSKSRAQPYVEPAYLAKREEALEAMAERIRSAILKRGGSV